MDEKPQAGNGLHDLAAQALPHSGRAASFMLAQASLLRAGKDGTPDPEAMAIVPAQADLIQGLQTQSALQEMLGTQLVGLNLLTLNFINKAGTNPDPALQERYSRMAATLSKSCAALGVALHAVRQRPAQAPVLHLEPASEPVDVPVKVHG